MGCLKARKEKVCSELSFTSWHVRKGFKVLRPKTGRVEHGRSTLGPFGPEQRLWLEVFKGAVKDLATAVKQIEAIDAAAIEYGQCGELLGSAKIPTEVRTALKKLKKALLEEREVLRCWFESDEIAPKSFAWVCLVLGLSKSRARGAAKRIMEGDKELMHIARERKRSTPNRKKLQKAA